MDTNSTALILIGYQNDYFAKDGVLHAVIEEASQANNVLENTLELVGKLIDTDVLIITTPIIFTPDYSELVDPVGILKVIKDAGAFKGGTKGAETIEPLRLFGDRILEVPGKRGLNAFLNTRLLELLKEKGITDIVLAGAVTSICIDSTGRFAFEQGFKVSILSDCTSGRTLVEQNFYCDSLFPLYANVITQSQLLDELKVKE